MRFTPLLIAALALGMAAWAALYVQDWLATMATDRARLAQMDVRLSAFARASAKPVSIGVDPPLPLFVTRQTTLSTDRQRQQQTIDELERRLAAVEQRIEGYAAQLSESAATPTKGVAAMQAPAAAGWVLNIATLSHQKSARNLIASLANNGVKAGLSTVNVDNQVLYRVRLKGFNSQALAEQEAMRLQSILGLGGLWVAQE